MKALWVTLVFSVSISLAAAADAPAKKAKARGIASDHDVAAETVISCGGTEPFWDVEFKKTADGKYTSSYNLAGTNHPAKGEWTAAPMRGTTGAYGLAFHAKQGGDLAIVVNDPHCSDNMSDNTYAYEVFFQRGKEVFYGCCKKTGGPE